MRVSEEVRKKEKRREISYEYCLCHTHVVIIGFVAKVPSRRELIFLR